MHRIAVVLVVAACSKGKPDDCAVVRDTPAQAMAELSKRYPNNPLKVAQTIETCVAPSGDECERIAKIVTAIPALAPIPAPKKFDYADVCRHAPPDMRRCLLPSYLLAHTEECRNLPIAIELTAQKPLADAPRARRDDCGFVAIYVDKRGTWLATGTDAKARCFAPRKAGALDVDWLEAQLRKAKTHPCGSSSAELAAANDVPYQEVVLAMDVSIKAGFMDTGLSQPSALAVPLAAADPKGAASECPATLIPLDPKDAATTPSNPLPTSSKDALVNAPVLIVTKTSLTLSAGGTSTDIATLTEASSAAKLDALTQALPPTRDGLLILQADESTPSKVINLVVETAKSAGYDNVMFAVKNK